MSFMKRSLCLLLTLAVLLPAFAGSVPEVSAANGYDPYKAIAYAEAHWDDGNGLCAEFVWNCLQAGGLRLSTQGLHSSPYVTTGVAEAACNAIGIPFTGVKDFPRVEVVSLYGPDLADKDDSANAGFGIGDLIFTYCDTCGLTPHVQICSGYEKSNAMCYSHNPARQHEMYLGGVTPGHSGHSLSYRYLDLSAAEEKTCECAKLFDVPEGEWYHSYVDEVLRRELMNGVSRYSFDPEGTMTRAMLVTVLWRYNLEPAEGTNGFSDVKNGQWYTDAIAWATRNGVVNGVGNNRFDPEGNVTREQLATILYRYTKSVGNDVSAREELDRFPDAAKVSDYAKEALSWAVAVGLVTGSQEGGKLYLHPQGSATRAQVGAILVRYIAQYGVVPDSGTYGDLTWELTADGTLTVSGTGEMPEVSGEMQVPWYANRNYIEKVVIGEGVTSVANYAFYKYPCLSEAILSDSVTRIGSYAFYSCGQLSRVRLGEGLQEIDNSVWQRCKNLTELSLPQGLTTLTANVFSGSGLTELRIPAGVREIVFDAYIYTEEAFPCPVYVDDDNMTYASDARGVLFNKEKTVLLRGHEKLSGSYAVPEGVTIIEAVAFRSCEKLTDVRIPTGVTSIGGWAFQDCHGLQSVQLPSTLTELGVSAFECCCRLLEAELPEGVSKIGEGTFLQCRQLRRVSVPQSVKKIGAAAFYGCISLTELKIPAGVTQLDFDTFTNDRNLRALYFFGDAPTIDEYALPKGVTLYYISGKKGWTSPTWNGYSTKTWTP